MGGAGDGFQRPRRSRFQARLTRGVRCQRHKGPSVQQHRSCPQLVGTSAMSTCKEAIQSGLEAYLQALQRALAGLTPAAVRWQPALHTNHIAWLVWHMARVEDRWISRLRQRPEVWTADGWAERF